ncbi:Insect cuticle protein,Chitin-binding type R&R consensus [Cinara cedri]|uniref:Insect cuticle protein,Chitin-binding type R&R consensus n=1 Tax=Cinara cedri TaxID=506608 RepID=A0A5E4M7X1_9HEMI|nr:Insect cuticle protein,Chitin-binding type R&R consensus [Cinara cedri]
MRFSFAFVASFVIVAAVSAGIYPAKTGGKGPAHAKNGSVDEQLGNSFHLQSPDGQYVFGHTTGNQGRAEIRDKDGTVTGYYSYADGNGQVVYVNYVADAKGYRVSSNSGVPSASVTVEGTPNIAVAPVETDFRKVFADFTERVKGKVLPRAGQEPVIDGQITVDTEFLDKETKPSIHGGGNGFPDWNQVKMSTTTQKSTDEIEHSEGQQQQEVVEPNWDDIVMAITTQKSNVKVEDGQGSSDNDWRSAITTETTPKASVSQESSTLAPVKEQYPNTVIPETRNTEITTEIVNSNRINTESNTVIADDTRNNSPVTRPVSILNDVQTTISYNDGSIMQTTEDTNSRGSFPTTMSSVRSFEEPSTIVQVLESVTEHFDQIVDKKKNEEKIALPIDTTTIRPFENSVLPDATTQYPSIRNDNFETTNAPADVVGFTTIGRAVDEKLDSASPAYEPAITTIQSDHSEVSNMATTTAGVQYVTEVNKIGGVEFRTLVPVGQIETTISPATFDQSAAQEHTEITWPEIPQEPATPQVLVPLDPYPIKRTKNSGVKAMPIKSRLASDFELNDEVTTMPTNNVDEVTPYYYPRYYLIG